MARLIMYFVAVLALLSVLRFVPVLGFLFGAHSLIGFFICAAIVSACVSWWTRKAVDARRQRALERHLGAVDTPHNQGKLGSMILAQGHAQRALAHLERASAGEPDSAEWAYRLGIAQLRVGRANAAALSLERAVARDEDHAFGIAQLRLSEARLAAGDAEAALGVVARYETGRGATPESALRRALAQRALGRRREARASLRESLRLLSDAAHFQRKAARTVGWQARFELMRT